MLLDYIFLTCIRDPAGDFTSSKLSGNNVVCPLLAIYCVCCTCILPFAAVHEKIFVVFMVTSLFHQLFVLILFKWAHPDMTATVSKHF